MITLNPVNDALFQFSGEHIGILLTDFDFDIFWY